MLQTAAPRVVCAILAAGRSARMGRPKALLRLAGATLAQRALAATEGFPTVVVTSAALGAAFAGRPDITIVVNDAPERGMAHSLRLADAAVAEREAALAVVLVDTPLVDAGLVERVVGARRNADVAYPARYGIAGHPVVFGPAVRAALAALPDGDTLRTLRDDARWTRVEVPIDDERPYFDCDTPADVRRAARFLRAVEPSTTAAKS